MAQSTPLAGASATETDPGVLEAQGALGAKRPCVDGDSGRARPGPCLFSRTAPGSPRSRPTGLGTHLLSLLRSFAPAIPCAWSALPPSSEARAHLFLRSRQAIISSDGLPPRKPILVSQTHQPPAPPLPPTPSSTSPQIHLAPAPNSCRLRPRPPSRTPPLVPTHDPSPASGGACPRPSPHPRTKAPPTGRALTVAALAPIVRGEAVVALGSRCALAALAEAGLVAPVVH